MKKSNFEFKKDSVRPFFLFLIICVIGLSSFFFIKSKRGYELSPVLNHQSVAVTIFPIADMAKKVSQGTNLEIVQIIPSGSSPHTFELNPSDQKKIESSVIIFKIGVGFDDWIDKFESNNRRIVDLSKSVSLIKKDGEIDPHYWLSVENAKLITQMIADELSKLYPSNRQTFEKNAQAYIVELTDLKSYAKDKSNKIQSKRLITFHDSFNYFAEENGFEIVKSFEEFPGDDPTADDIKELIEIINKFGIIVIYKEPQFSDLALKSFQNDNGVLISELDPLGGSNEIQSFIDLIKFNIDKIFQVDRDEIQTRRKMNGRFAIQFSYDLKRAYFLKDLIVYDILSLQSSNSIFKDVTFLSNDKVAIISEEKNCKKLDEYRILDSKLSKISSFNGFDFFFSPNKEKFVFVGCFNNSSSSVDLFLGKEVIYSRKQNLFSEKKYFEDIVWINDETIQFNDFSENGKTVKINVK